MKLIVISDIHMTPSDLNFGATEGSRPFFRTDHENFAKEIHAEKPDILLVTGDCAEGASGSQTLLDFLNIYRNPHGVSLCIPGNHDMWFSRNDTLNKLSVEDKYKNWLTVANSNGWIALDDTPYEKEGWYISGNMGWYDFSMIDPDCKYGYTRSATGNRQLSTITPIEYERQGNWSDYNFMFPLGSESKTPMLDFCRNRMRSFRRSLSDVPVKKRKGLVVASHFVGFDRLLAKFRDADYGRAFFGNTEIGELACKNDADYYFCGHSHKYVKSVISGVEKDMICINNGSGYGFGSKRMDMVEL